MTEFIDLPMPASLLIQVYPPEYIFAEKLETIARLGIGITRLKDFVYLWTLLQNKMNMEKLRSAIGLCYLRIGIEFDLSPLFEFLKDRHFAEERERARQRNFSDVPNPVIHDLFSEILNFVRKLIERNEG